MPLFQCTLRAFLRRSLLLSLLIALFHPAPHVARAGSVLVSLAGSAVDGEAAWADYDNDGDMDLVVGGMGASGQRVTVFYRAKKAHLEQAEVGLPRLEAASLDWGDYDNDGYLDLLVAGMAGYGPQGIIPLAGVYHNVPDPSAPGERAFTLAHDLPGVYHGQAAWVDYNQDARLDLLLTGYAAGGQPFTRLYRGRPGGFEEAQAPFAALGGGGAAWADYTGDDFPDLTLFGRDASGAPRLLVYAGQAGAGFTLAYDLTGVWGGCAVWLDADSDGSLDLLVTGNHGDNLNNIQPLTQLFHNLGGSLSLSGDGGLPHLWRSSLAAADYDGDGDADLLASGLTRWERVTRIYLNQGGLAFTDAQAGLPEAAGLSVAWADVNADRAPDVTLAGVPDAGDFLTQVLVNPHKPASLPRAPLLEAACWDGASRVTFHWSPAGSPTLTYNLRIGASPGGTEILHPQSDLDNGERRLPKPGAAYTGTTAVFQALDFTSPGTLKWAVQAVDAGLSGGPFSAEGRFPYGERIAVDDAYTTLAGTPLALDLLGNDNAAFAPLNLYAVQQPSHGTLQASGAVLVYTPAPYWSGTDTFTYQAVGLERYCTQAVVTVQVTSLDTPVSVACARGCGEYAPASRTVAVTMSEDGDPLPFDLSLRGEDSGAGEPLTWRVSSPARGAASIAPVTLPGEENPVSYAPPPGWSGADAFTVTVSDPFGSQAEIQVAVQVLPVDHAPTTLYLPLVGR